ncbi:MAG: 50S ribosomal protein L19 [Patescibacteria group bacterium]|nr:50S ribosomal protein L19 [Patescibacteria group bacterium]
MTTKTEQFNKIQLKDGLSEIRSGDTVQVFQKIKEKDKQRIQIFEGLVLARKHGKGINSTIKVRKIVSGVGVERTFPVHSPNVEDIKIIRRGKARRSKLYYLRTAKGKKSKLKKIDFEQGEVNKTTEVQTEEIETEKSTETLEEKN